MRILLIDDEPESVGPLVEELTERGAYQCSTCSFEEAQSRLREFKPDIVVLDLLKVSVSGEAIAVGEGPFEYIWSSRFTPIIVYSAEPGRLTAEEHPFVRSIEKGGGSELRVAQLVEEFTPHVEALERAVAHLEEVSHQALREVAPVLHQHQAEVLIGAVRRQVAARLDLERLGNRRLRALEQYLIPPVFSSLATGDVLRTVEGSVEEPTCYRVVLTPTCDLVIDEGRAAKVEAALVAKCFPLSALVGALNPQTGKLTGKVREKLPRILTGGFLDGLLPLPAFPSIVPSMVANFKRLEVIPLDEIGLGGGGSYSRVAAIDSPFRELVTWSYLQTAGRPGIPDRDIDAWVEEICVAIEAGERDEGN